MTIWIADDFRKIVFEHKSGKEAEVEVRTEDFVEEERLADKVVYTDYGAWEIRVSLVRLKNGRVGLLVEYELKTPDEKYGIATEWVDYEFVLF